MNTHQSLVKTAVEEALGNWKTNTWGNNIISTEVYQTLASQVFPVPDAMLYDPVNKYSIAIEFKPPTENKRGILTGIGQGISYLSQASFAYLFAPSVLEQFDLAGYLENLFNDQITGKIPLGLVCYSEESGKGLEIIKEIDSTLQLKPKLKRGVPNRYWAKHIDMPLHLLWIILNIAYKLPEQSDKREAIWRNCFDTVLFPQDHRNTLDVIPTCIIKHDGSPMFILDKIKRKLKKQVDRGTLTYQDALAELNLKVIPGFSGDNYYNSLKKNFMTFIKHLQLIDDTGQLTEDGLLLHRIGFVHKPNGETFKNYFAHMLLYNGKHLELILDVEKITRNHDFNNVSEAIEAIKSEYVSRGLYKENPGRRVHEGTEPFLKYERIIWGHLGMLDKVGGSQYIPGHGFAFNWDQITKLCSIE